MAEIERVSLNPEGKDMLRAKAGPRDTTFTEKEAGSLELLICKILWKERQNGAGQAVVLY